MLFGLVLSTFEGCISKQIGDFHAALPRSLQGHGLLHKAVFLGHGEVARWLVERYPETAEVRDWVSEEMSQ